MRFMRWSIFLHLALVLWNGALNAEPCSIPDAFLKGLRADSRTDRNKDVSAKGLGQFLIDVSASMRGYVVAKPDQSMLFRDLIRVVPDVLDYTSDQVRYLHFGTRIREFDPGKLGDLLRPDTYKDLESHIGDALRSANLGSPNDLTVVITDLFVNAKELLRTGPTAIRQPLTAALRSGRAIGILGVLSAFKGFVYDMPTATTKVEIEALRPVFVFAIGPVERVLDLKRRLQTDLLDSLPADQWRFSLFTGNLGATRRPTNLGPAILFTRGVREDVPLVTNFGNIRSLVLDRRHEALKLNEASLGFSSIEAPDLPHLIGIEAKSQLWIRHDNEKNCDRVWEPIEEAAGLARTREGNAMPVEILGSIGNPLGLPSRRTYLLRVDIEATKAEAKADSRAWFSAWSFGGVSERTGDDVTQKFGRVAGKLPHHDPKDVFPVLNLGALATLLSAVQSESFERVLVGSAVLKFKID